MLFRQNFFGLLDHLGYVVFPLLANTTGIGFVNHLEIQVVELVQFVDDLAGKGDLDFYEPRMLERQDLGPRAVVHAVDVVLGIHRRGSPHGLRIKRAEKVHLDNDPTFLCRGHEAPKAGEVGGVPPTEIELISAVKIARRIAAGPGANIAIFLGGKRVVGNTEGAEDLAVRAGEYPRMV